MPLPRGVAKGQDVWEINFLEISRDATRTALLTRQGQLRERLATVHERERLWAARLLVHGTYSFHSHTVEISVC